MPLYGLPLLPVPPELLFPDPEFELSPDPPLPLLTILGEGVGKSVFWGVGKLVDDPYCPEPEAIPLVLVQHSAQHDAGQFTSWQWGFHEEIRQGAAKRNFNPHVYSFFNSRCLLKLDQCNR